jgi:hypothetical protein
MILIPILIGLVRRWRRRRNRGGNPAAAEAAHV